MRKSIIPQGAEVIGGTWLDVASLARVEVTSEDDGHPVESALADGEGPGWRAGVPGPQVIRLRFDEPAVRRTHEFTLRWAAGDGPAREVVRQQWTFSPGGSTQEAEDHRVDLPDATVLELAITPDISGGDARASLAAWRVS